MRVSDKQAYTVIYSGLENRTRQLGTGFMITNLIEPAYWNLKQSTIEYAELD
jgi:hypothetical protein